MIEKMISQGENARPSNINIHEIVIKAIGEEEHFFFSVKNITIKIIPEKYFNTSNSYMHIFL